MKLWKWFKSLFNKALRIFKQFINDVFTETNKIIIGEFKDMAIEIVSKIDAQVLTNEEKREKAFKELKKNFKKEGIKVKDSLIYTLIELAVQYLKKYGKIN